MVKKISLEEVKSRLAKKQPAPKKMEKEPEKKPEVEERPIIVVTTQEFQVAAAAAELLAKDETIFQRSGSLVRLARDESVSRSPVAKIELLPPPILRSRLTKLADWNRIRHTEKGEQEIPCHVPDWCTSAIYFKGQWSGVRPLEAVVTCPIIRKNGTILSTPGYDKTTGVYGDFDSGLADVAAKPTKKDCLRAKETIEEVLKDFPFQNEYHKSAWFAALLTPLARFAFDGPAPLFLIEANTKGAGKKLLCDVLSVILTGERFPVTTYCHEEEEMRKRITSLALAGERMVLFDNVDQKLGNAALDAALTATSWKDRSLGSNRIIEVPLYMTWYATGNNCQIATDTARRVCPIRLESPEEFPEQRTGFFHKDLISYVRSHRSQLLSAALTILRGYFIAGRPVQSVKSWGSFEGFSKLVRCPLLWIGMSDPAETRIQISLHADTSTAQNETLLTLWEFFDPEGKGMTASEIIEQANLFSEIPSGKDFLQLLADMFRKPDARSLGIRLRSIRRRIFSGKFIDSIGESHKVAKWAVLPLAKF